MKYLFVLICLLIIACTSSPKIIRDNSPIGCNSNIGKIEISFRGDDVVNPIEVIYKGYKIFIDSLAISNNRKEYSQFYFDYDEINKKIYIQLKECITNKNEKCKRISDSPKINEILFNEIYSGKAKLVNNKGEVLEKIKINMEFDASGYLYATMKDDDGTKLFKKLACIYD